MFEILSLITIFLSRKMVNTSIPSAFFAWSRITGNVLHWKLWDSFLFMLHVSSFQKKHCPKRNFMSGQSLINKSMRAILVDWLVEVAEEYSLVSETLFLTVNYIDRFLSSDVAIDPSKLQLVGVSCMLIASKLEEIYPPEIAEFVYITNSTYTADEVCHD